MTTATETTITLSVEHVRNSPRGEFLIARLLCGAEEIGNVTGYVRAGGKLEPQSELRSEFQGRGLGLAAYEALYAAAKDIGINVVKGGVHSMAAHRLHRKLAVKYGYGYTAEEVPALRSFGFTHGGYEYGI